MSKLLSTILFSLFLLFQTTVIADESNETQIEVQTDEAQETEAAEEEKPSEAELEAQKAEEDEIRESEAEEKAEEE